MRRTLMSFSFLIFQLSFSVAQTLEECQQAAERNYPLIRQYDMISKTTALTVDNIQKGWLPQVSAQAQATYQNRVTEWPEQMQTMYEQMGLQMAGLKKDQYRVGIDVQQTVYDGGAISSQKEIARRQGAVEEAQTAVTMYQVRRRVNEMYFGLLLLDEQIRLNGDLQTLLTANENKLQAMFKRGTAAESDYLSVKAERLKTAQQLTGLEAQRQTVLRMLSAFCGIEVKTAEKPVPSVVSLTPQTGLRPELRAIEAQLLLADAQEKALRAALMPKLGVFAQGFYGYPGYNMFDDMMRRHWSWNGMIGARLTWNIGALYTHKNDKAKIDAQRSLSSVQRDVFLFNNKMEQTEQSEDIERYRRLMTDDEAIIALRAQVRKAAESKLAHGIIDVNDLVKEIKAENSARVQQSIHEIEMLKEMYNLKYTTGRPSLGPSL
jgi:outer membrane protein TolC